MKSRKFCTSAAIVAVTASPALLVADDEETPFAVAEIFFELNNTDGDLGIHSLIDGEPWKRLTIEDKNERTLLNARVKGRLRRQGLTEIFFESAEPQFDDLAPATFFRRFPAGTYEVEGITLDGEELESETELTHAMPAPPNPTVNGTAVAMQCDDEEPGYDAPTVEGDVVIAWDPVARTHASLGNPQDSPDISIFNYQLVVEAELETPNGEEFASVLSVILPPGVTAMTVPEEFLTQSDTFKYEVLAREVSWNQTAIESCFLLQDDE
ncbi:MAG: hypothetical protein K0U72_02475 [Gammaproteobacteria bacterium]|nr:hypothetical protein [Gammaproteobacteria bacterium]